jgi:hypothetical protein
MSMIEPAQDVGGGMAKPDEDVGRRTAAREFFAAALYMALVQWAALVAVPTERIPDSGTVVALLLGTAVGLVLAHWLAFRLAAHLTEGGFAAASAAREAGSQVAGGLSVGVIAALPFVFVDAETAIQIAVVILAALPALTGMAIARLRDRSWGASVVFGGAVLIAALAVVAVKAAAGH